MSTKKIKVPKKSIDLQEEIPNLFERFKTWLEEHPYPILGSIVVLVMVAILWWGVSSYRTSKEDAAQAAYAQALKNWPGEKAADAKAEEAAEPKVEETTDPKAMEKIVPDLEKFIAEHQGTKSAYNARLDVARGYFELHRYEDALKWSKAVLEEVSPKSELRPLATYQLALTLQALGKTDEALEQWKNLKNMGLAGLEREVNWHMARIYLGKGEPAKSIEQYEAAVKASGTYPPADQLQDELSAIKLKTASSNQPPESTAAKDEPKS